MEQVIKEDVQASTEAKVFIAQTTLSNNAASDMKEGVKYTFIFESGYESEEYKDKKGNSLSFAVGTIDKVKHELIILRKDRNVPAKLIVGNKYTVYFAVNGKGYMS